MILEGDGIYREKLRTRGIKKLGKKVRALESPVEESLLAEVVHGICKQNVGPM